jgi:hypothetical protein
MEILVRRARGCAEGYNDRIFLQSLHVLAFQSDFPWVLSCHDTKFLYVCVATQPFL